MKSIRRTIIIIIALLGIISCNRINKSKEIGDSSIKAIAQSKFARIYPSFNPEHFKERLSLEIEKDSLLLPYYNYSRFAPLWSNDTLNTTRLYAFIDILNQAQGHGLDPNIIFNKDLIQALTDSIDSGLFADNIDTLYVKMTILEKLSAKSFFKYVIGMNYGFLKPTSLYKEDYAIATDLPDSLFYANLYQEITQDPIATLLESQPKNKVYKKMQEEYSSLENIKDIDFPKINNIGNNLYKKGAANNNITAIAKRLMVTGEYATDSISNDSTHFVLDEKLLTAVNYFRKKNSYPEESEIGNLTIEALNRPVTYYQDRLKANMERYRWRHNKQKHDKHIDVIVPAFKLIATQKNDSAPLVMRVCVGTILNKTPLLESNLSYMNLNPKWNVPKSIARGEISILQKKDRTYLKKRNMKLFKNGKEIDPETIDWDNMQPSKFNYFVRQDPGNANSLGRIKFMFKNDFAVYLHDTPIQSAFSRKNRAVSHGCIRVQRPVDLAFFCLPTTSDVYKDQLRYSIDRNPETKDGKELLKQNKLTKIPDIINIKENISLTIDYYTVYMHPDEDSLYYADDVYDYDSAILEKLSH